MNARLLIVTATCLFVVGCASSNKQTTTKTEPVTTTTTTTATTTAATETTTDRLDSQAIAARLRIYQGRRDAGIDCSQQAAQLHDDLQAWSALHNASADTFAYCDATADAQTCLDAWLLAHGQIVAAAYILDSAELDAHFLAYMTIATAVVEPAPVTITSGMFGRVFFDTNSTRLDGEDQEHLRGVAGILADHPMLSVVVRGFADARGPESYNANLSQRRAERVISWLAAQGVETSRMSAHGAGIVNGDYNTARRVEFVISSAQVSVR